MWRPERCGGPADEVARHCTKSQELQQCRSSQALLIYPLTRFYKSEKVVPGRLTEIQPNSIICTFLFLYLCSCPYGTKKNVPLSAKVNRTHSEVWCRSLFSQIRVPSAQGWWTRAGGEAFLTDDWGTLSSLSLSSLEAPSSSPSWLLQELIICPATAGSHRDVQSVRDTEGSGTGERETAGRSCWLITESWLTYFQYSNHQQRCLEGLKLFFLGFVLGIFLGRKTLIGNHPGDRERQTVGNKVLRLQEVWFTYTSPLSYLRGQTYDAGVKIVAGPLARS